jgi:hypothetical protein
LSNQNKNGGNTPDQMPSRVLTLDPTRKDAGASYLTVTVLYDPLNKTVQVKGSQGIDIIGLVGILELAKNSVVMAAMNRPS